MEDKDEKWPVVLPAEGVPFASVEKGLLVQALERTKGNQTAAARLLQISRNAFRYRMKKFGLFTTAKELHDHDHDDDEG